MLKNINVVVLIAGIAVTAIIFYAVIFGFHLLVGWVGGLSPGIQITLKIFMPIFAVIQLVLFTVLHFRRNKESKR